MDAESDPKVIVAGQLVIPIAELEFRYSRSSGPGGQHVQRSDTRVELLFDVAGTPSLSDEQRARVRARLAGYIDGEGVLRIVSSATRSQSDNRADAVAKFTSLMAAAVRVRKRRLPTRPSMAARQARLEGKRARALTKRARRRPGEGDYE